MKDISSLESINDITKTISTILKNTLTPELSASLREVQSAYTNMPKIPELIAADAAIYSVSNCQISKIYRTISQNNSFISEAIAATAKQIPEINNDFARVYSALNFNKSITLDQVAVLSSFAKKEFVDSVTLAVQNSCSLSDNEKRQQTIDAANDLSNSAKMVSWNKVKKAAENNHTIDASATDKSLFEENIKYQDDIFKAQLFTLQFQEFIKHLWQKMTDLKEDAETAAYYIVIIESLYYWIKRIIQ